VIPGHGGTVDRAALVAHRDMILALRDKVAPLVKQGRTLEQVTARNSLRTSIPRFRCRYHGDRFIGQLYAELQAAK
jgi:hypothetical protein